MRFTEILAVSLATGLALAAPTVIELDERGLPCSKGTTTTSSSSTLSSSSSSTSSLTSSSITTKSSALSSSTSASSSASSPASSTIASTSTSSSSSTTTIAAATVTPSNPAVVGNFVYGGCVAEPFYNGVAGVRALTGTSTSSSSMTVEYCASFCAGYTYFGVEYSSQCYCGNALSDGTTLDNTVSDCSAICSGNAGEYCGGSAHLNLYQLSSAGTLNLPLTYTVTSTSATATATGSGSGSGSGSASATSTVVASAVASSGNYNYIACAVEAFVNGASGRSLGDAGTSNGTAMTVEYCASFCSGYTYFGVEYADECYCGNSIATGTTQDTTGGCNMACVGNAAELCGGSGRFNLYELASSPAVVLPTTYIAPTTSSSTTSAAATSVVAATSVIALSSSSSSAAAVTTAASSTSSAATTTSKASSSSVSSSSTSSAAAATSSKASSTSAVASTTSSAAAKATTCAPASYDISTCTAITQSFPLFGNYKYNNYYSGSGYTENISNPGNLWNLILPPITIAIPATNNACQAAASCMLRGGLLSVVYHSFDLHWRTDSCAWECTMFAGQNTASSYFNVPSSAVGRGFGFSGSSC